MKFINLERQTKKIFSKNINSLKRLLSNSEFIMGKDVFKLEDKLNGQESFIANQEEEPLILYDETTKEKENEQNNLSPAVRKIVTEKKN